MGYPLLSFIVTGCWMLAFAGVFLAFGWCDPREYQRKIGLDIFSGVMAVIALRVGSSVKNIVHATVEARSDGALIDMKSILSFVTGCYDQINFESFFDKIDNELLALIAIGVSIMLAVSVAVLSVVFGVYFVFRICALIDVYVNNRVRFIIMGAALVITLIVGISSHQTSLMLITMLLGIVSIIKLAIGNVMLKYYGENFPTNKREPQRAAGAPARRPAPQGARPQPPRGTRPPQAGQRPPQGARPQYPAGRPAAPQGQPRQNPPRPAAPAAPRAPQQTAAPGSNAPHTVPYANNPPTRTRPAPKAAIYLGDDDE